MSTYSSMDLKPWKGISITDIVVFLVCLIGAAYPLSHISRVAFTKFPRIIILYSLLVLTKIVAGGLSLSILNDINELTTSKGINLYIAASVLMSLAPGFLMMITFNLVQFLNSLHHPKVATVGKKGFAHYTIRGIVTKLSTPGQRLDGVESVYWVVVIATLALSSAGNGIMYTDFSTAKSLIRAASILYLVELLVLAGLIIYAIKELRGSIFGRVENRKYAIYLLFLSATSTAFTGVRVVAYVCSAFAIQIGSTGYTQSRFSFLLGEWRLYAFITFMPECVACLLWVLSLWSLSGHLKYVNNPFNQFKLDEENI